jgi:ABC-type sulfate transport system permease component
MEQAHVLLLLLLLLLLFLLLLAALLLLLSFSFIHSDLRSKGRSTTFSRCFCTAASVGAFVFAHFEPDSGNL